ncbi:protein root UVB sensitive 6 [Senna tora]|uniref:Protein root UVB sensitive 6 n=1 Tax=Senna tora TaxID=362788 RepID=A0A834SG02_9FABA|nr:protein root UVB sensitive 6 [Senna tora]
MNDDVDGGEGIGENEVVAMINRIIVLTLPRSEVQDNAFDVFDEMPQRTAFYLLTYAFDVFEEMPQRTAFYLLTYAFDVFEEMPQRAVPPNSCRKNLPHLFLPLACAANVVKNVAVVTSTSTRTPIYKAFAKGENIGDVTAKGECVGNIADLILTSAKYGPIIAVHMRNATILIVATAVLVYLNMKVMATKMDRAALP